VAASVIKKPVTLFIIFSKFNNLANFGLSKMIVNKTKPNTKQSSRTTSKKATSKPLKPYLPI